MKRCLAIVLVLTACSAIVRADLTIVQTTTIEGGMAAMAPGGVPTPKVTTRVKGMKARSDIDMSSAAGSTSTITDLVAGQVILLRHDQKTTQVTTAATVASSAASAPPVAVTFDGAMTPTGKSQVLDGMKCDEFTFTTSIAMANLGGPQVPPEAGAMMKDLTMLMKGSMWVAKEVPGAAEYVAFQKGLLKADLTAAAAGAGGAMPGMDKLMKAMANVEGVPYLTEMTMSVEGPGQIGDMMRQMGPMKITMKVSSVTADALSDDLFKTPEGYTVVK